MEDKFTDIQIRAYFEIYDPKTSQTIKREITTSYYPGNNVKSDQTIVRKSMKKIMADMSKLKPVKVEQRG